MGRTDKLQREADVVAPVVPAPGAAQHQLPVERHVHREHLPAPHHQPRPRPRPRPRLPRHVEVGRVVAQCVDALL